MQVGSTTSTGSEPWQGTAPERRSTAQHSTNHSIYHSTTHPCTLLTRQAKASMDGAEHRLALAYELM